MNYYLILLRRETIDFATYSPEDMQKLMVEFDKWNASLISKNQMIASGNLPVNKGKIIRTGNVVSDGPYSEAKEAVSGFFIIKAENDDKASEFAAGCPFIPRGGSVEIRPMPQLEFEDAARLTLEESIRAREASKRKGS